jgi:hypothetical protein
LRRKFFFQPKILLPAEKFEAKIFQAENFLPAEKFKAKIFPAENLRQNFFSSQKIFHQPKI